MAHFTLRGAVHGLLVKDGRVLLLRRFNTGWQDGNYALPAGHIDGNETFTTAMIREMTEELGIIVDPTDVEFVNMTHHASNQEYVYVVFAINKWQGEPTNMEPEKCDDLQWFDIENLPSNMTNGAREALINFREKNYYTEEGWS